MRSGSLGKNGGPGAAPGKRAIAPKSGLFFAFRGRARIALSELITLRHFHQSPAQLATYFLHWRGRTLRVVARRQILPELFLSRLLEAVHDHLPCRKFHLLLPAARHGR